MVEVFVIEEKYQKAVQERQKTQVVVDDRHGLFAAACTNTASIWLGTGLGEPDPAVSPLLTANRTRLGHVWQEGEAGASKDAPQIHIRKDIWKPLDMEERRVP